MEDLNREERVKLPEGWNSYNKTWITKDGFKDQKGKEITDIDDKIKKFIELLNNVDVSKFEGGITNFCFRFPYIVKDIFGTECKLQKIGWFGKDKSTNPFDYKGYVRIAYCVSYKQIVNSMPAFKKLYDYYKIGS